MNIEEAIKKFLMNIIDFINDRNPIEKIEDIKDSYENDSLESFLHIIRETVEISPKFKTLNTILQVIEKTITSEDFEKCITVEKFLNGAFDFKILDDSNEFKNRLRNFSFGDERGAAIQHSFFEDKEEYINKNNIKDIDSDAIERKIMEIIVYMGSLPNNHKSNSLFLEFLLSSNSDKTLLMKKVDSDWTELYAYLYFRYIAKGYKTSYSEEIIYEYNPEYIEAEITSLSDENLKFLQFFEILDVLDEYHHANDILSRYLKLYQIIEYLMIRFILVKIQRNAHYHKQFIRELGSFKKYDDFDKKLLKKLFADDNVIDWFMQLVRNNANIKNEVEKYIREYKNIDVNNNEEKYWWNIFSDLLCQLRNSIVHNKESELHLTVHTVSNETTDLIREIINHLEKILIKKIIVFHDDITYVSDCIKVY